MIFIRILFDILGLITLVGWGLMIFTAIKEWKNIGKFKGFCTFLLVSFLAAVGTCSLFSSYPF